MAKTANGAKKASSDQEAKTSAPTTPSPSGPGTGTQGPAAPQDQGKRDRAAMPPPPPPPQAKGVQKYKLVFFCPPSATQACMDTLFKAGDGWFPGSAASVECGWQAMGRGAFRTLSGDMYRPYSLDQTEMLAEVRCEFLCLGEPALKRAVKALKTAHPYKDPPIDVYKLENY